MIDNVVGIKGDKPREIKTAGKPVFAIAKVAPNLADPSSDKLIMRFTDAVFDNFDVAMNEAKTLATDNPGSPYVVFESVRVCLVG